LLICWADGVLKTSVDSVLEVGNERAAFTVTKEAAFVCFLPCCHTSSPHAESVTWPSTLKSSVAGAAGRDHDFRFIHR
jgi:hypothetical protein